MILQLPFPLQGIQAFSQRHRVGLVVGTAILLAGFALTAVAVAPLVAQPPPVAQRLVTESIAPQGLAAQLADLAAADISLTRSTLTRDSDTAEALLGRLGVQDAEAATFIRKDSTARMVLSGRSGKMIQARTDAQGGLKELIARFPADRAELARTHFTRLTLAPVEGHWLARLESVAFGAQLRLASGTVRSTLFAATDESGLPDIVASQLAEIFSTDIDFHRELRRGDTFSVAYESLTADGEPVAWNDGAGRVAAAEFVNGGRSRHAIWFAGADGRGGYYDIDGRSKRRAFLASPLAFSRVTSGFAMRFHPLMQSWRQHNGVDYSAPTGTAVRAVGDGTVEFAGRMNGYGNVVEVKHGNGRGTLYAHLSRIEVRKGQRVDQGQRLGAVGSTGWATGPHLHFEFRVGGQHQDPLRIAKASETVPLDSASRPRFAELVRRSQDKLALAQSLTGPRVRVE